LAALLRELKGKCGLSYAEWARRSLTTASTLHRYCNGLGVPADYRVVVSIAEEAGADQRQLAALALLWSRARGECAEASAPDPGAGADGPVAAAGLPAPPPGRRWGGGGRARAVAAARWVAAVVCLLLCATAGAAGPGPGGGVGDPAAGGPGDAWTAYPWAVEGASMGVTVNSNTGRMPAFGVGSVRFWDSGTRWADLEPHPGAFDWAPLDRLVGGARRAGLPSLYTLGGTPQWAAPGAPRTLYADGSRTAPPDDLREWEHFVQALVSRYRGRIGAYELWDTATDTHFYSGTPQTLALMARGAARIVHRTDPRATVVCPSMGSLGTPGGSSFVRAFATAGGFEQCDAVAVKVAERPARVPPEDITVQVERFEAALHALGTGAPVWITGPDYDVTRAEPLHGAAAADWAARFFLAMVYERLNHVRRAYFYDWGGSDLPVVLQPEGRAATPAGRAVGRLHAWLAGAYLSGCGHGRAAGLPAGAWRCTFTRTAATHGPAVIAWTEHGTARVPVPYPGGAAVHLDGTVRHPSGSVRLTGAPVLLTP
jgi:hypothetical protein